MYNKRNSLLVFLVIALSGIPPISWKAPIILPILLIYLLFLFYNQGLKLDKFFLKVLLFLSLLTIIHVVEFRKFSFITTSSLFIRFTVPYLAYKIVGRKQFITKYVNILYYYSIISFFFVIPSTISPTFHKMVYAIASTVKLDYINSIPQHFILYTVEARGTYGLIQNAGPFWEHGAFAGYLIIALIFNVFFFGNPLKEKRNIIFILAIITTLSTAGYLLLFVFILGYFYLNSINKRRFYWLLILPFLFYLFWNAYEKIDFLGQKIETQIRVAESKRGLGIGGGRFISAFTDLEDIKEYPLFGKGRISEVRFTGYYLDTNSKMFHRTNGITDFIVKYGILFSIFYFYYYYKGFKLLLEKYFKYREKAVALFILFIIMMFGFSQVIFQQSLFILLLYFHLNNNRNIERTQRIQINEN